ncbi:hypothetical protein K435DRAFT_965987 [Dendrothele bispora CBS 962.96]|uniref:Uncharacterized protein n=1 Tax=Dendrothele bispora (strain CBS 962.96) TaxID=1314807 RepID=A0A4S8M2H8_DENBC|nr:hypothetical protein K435DRAFT_965987 [Dendrothele bispora CBS 962.96]
MSASASFGELTLPSDSIQYLQQIVVWQAVEGLFYGLQCLLTISACAVLIERGLRNSISRCLLLATTATMFTVSTVIFVNDILRDLKRVQAEGDPEFDLISALRVNVIPGTILVRISYLLGDLIVVWRAWILFDRELRPRLFLASCVLISSCVIITDGVLNVKAFSAPEDSKPLGYNDTYAPVRVLLPAGLLFTNLGATLCIGYKTWYYRRFIQSLFQERGKRDYAQQVLILLVESGFLYCICLLFDLIAVIGVFGFKTLVFLGTIAPYTASMYPTIIILLSAMQKTHCDATLRGQAGSESIRFAPPSTSSVSSSRMSRLDARRLSSHIETHLTFNSDFDIENRAGAKENEDLRISRFKQDRTHHSGPSRPLPCLLE